ncbi:5934_t:CDS:1, partial [Paraglomus brasilianum]
NGKENAFYNSYDALTNSMVTEHNTDFNSLTWGDKVELELNALKDTTNIWNNTSEESLNREQEETQLPPTEGDNWKSTINEEKQEEQKLEQELMQDPVEETDQNTLLLQDKVTDNNSHRSWAAALFPKLKRGRATFSTFSPRNAIKSKNNNALIIDIHNIQSSFNEIMASLFESTKYDISAAKAHFTKGTRTHLEVTFIDKDKQRHYAAKGLEILRKTYYGYIPVDTRKTFLQVRCKNVPLGNKNDITEALRESFGSFGNIVSIKPMLIEGTPYVSDQWIITFETTEDPDLENKLPRFTH